MLPNRLHVRLVLHVQVQRSLHVRCTFVEQVARSLHVRCTFVARSLNRLHVRLVVAGGCSGRSASVSAFGEIV